MATPIRIKRRTSPGSPGAPASLYQAELAFNEVDKTLYYGYGLGAGINAASIIAIGGEGQFVTIGTAQTISGSKIFSNPIVGSFSNALSIGNGLSQSGTSYDGSSARSISLPLLGTAGTYGSATSVPVITTDAYGRITGVSTSTISTTINIAGNSGTGSVPGGGTLSIYGGTGITTNAGGSGVTIAIDSTVVTLTGTQTLTNKTLTLPIITSILAGAGNTLTLPAAVDTLVGKTTTDVFTNKTFDTAGTGNVFKVNNNQITAYTGTGATVVLQNSPTLFTPTIATILNGGTLTLPTSTDTLVGTATTNTFTNKTFDTAGAGNVLRINGTQVSSVTGTGSSVVLATSPVLITPTLGVASATSINKVAITTPATSATLTIADGKTLTASNTLTFTGTDSSSVNFGTGGTVLYLNGPLGTPSSGTLTNCIGLPISTGITGLASGIATFLATPSSTNLAAALTDETGAAGNLVFSGSPTITTPIIAAIQAGAGNTLTLPATIDTLVGRATTDTLTNKTFDAAGTGNVFRINGNQINNYTGTGLTIVLQVSPTITTPVITAIQAGVGNTLTLPATIDTLVGKATTDTLTNKTFDTAGAGNVLKLSGNQVIGYTGTGTSVVLANSPALTTPNIGAATATSITGSSGNLTITAASGNNNVSLVPTGTGVVNVNNARITNVSDPLLPLDAVNKQYADAIASSLNIHSEVQAATAVPVSYTYVGGGTSQIITTIASNVITFSTGHSLAINSQIKSNATSNGLVTGTTYYVITTPNTNQVTISTTPGGSTQTLTDGSGLNISVTTNQGVGAQLTGTGQTVDGYTVVLGDRILVKDHTNSAYNGIYVVTTVGTGANGVWTRSSDFDNSPTGEISSGDYVFVGSGTTNGKTGFVQTAGTPIIPGTSPITFTQFTAANTYVAGTGISISANNISISGTYSGQSSINTVGTITSGTWNGNVISPTYGGTGVSNGSNTITLSGNISTGGSFITSGAFPITLYATAGTGVTLPTTGTLATLAGSETLTNKTLTAPSLSAETFSTTNNITAGTNAQGQSALTSDYNVITTAANNPSGVTLPSATTGRKIVIVNKGANQVNVYPATGAQIDAVGTNNSIAIPVNGWMEFNASSTTQWYSTYNATINPSVTNGGTGVTATPTNGQLLIGNGTGYTLNTLGAGTGISVANGSGTISISNTGVTSLATSGLGISASGSTGAVTISSGATSANTASSIVYRDASGNFSAGTITASGLTLSSALTVPNGGTGVTTFTSKGILYGNGSGAIQVTVAAGTGDTTSTNQILTVDANGFPVWASVIDGGSFAFLIGLSTLMFSIFHSGTFA